MPAHRSYSFGDYALDLDRGALLRNGVDVRLRPKSYEVLRVLVERHGALVTKDELFDAVWGRTIVTEGSITQCLIEIRRAIGDEAQQGIRTVPRRGYIFDVPVVEASGDEPREPAPSRTEAQPASPSARKPPVNNAVQKRRRIGAPLVTLAIVALAALAALALRDARRGEQAAMRTAPARTAPSNIAVLPFVNMSPEPDQEFFSDGISEEILNLLAQSDHFRVTARTSSFAFKGQTLSVAEIAQRLGVDYVLEGSVRKSGKRLRITAQLVEAEHSAHLWTQTYDRELADTFAIQTEIATKVAEALEVRLTRGEQPPVDYTPRAEAHERFLRAQFFYHRRAPGDLERARQHYEAALQIDPQYARAWAGLAGVYGLQFVEGDVPVEVGLEKRAEAVEKALTNDPNLAEAHMRAAQHFWETGDGQRAADHAAIAFELDRNDPLVLSHYCTLLAWEDRFDDALELEHRMVTRDPFSLAVRINLANTLLAAGRLDDARNELLKAVELSPDWEPAVEVELTRLMILEGRHAEALDKVRAWPPGTDRDHALALIDYALGDTAEADEAVRRLEQTPGPSAAVRLAEIHASHGDLDAAFDWVNEAYDRLGKNPWLSAEWRWVLPLRFSPFLNPLHDDARWSALRIRGLPPGTQSVLASMPDSLTRHTSSN
jgi:TolB-like protein/DNA-binding winged helix-turn-helix (wHTH) protein/Flp pilus assembly protein TadD